MLTLKNKFVLLLGIGMLLAVFTASSFANVAKADGEVYTKQADGSIKATGGYYVGTVTIQQSGGNWVIVGNAQLNFNGSKCSVGNGAQSSLNLIYNVDTSKNTIAYSGRTLQDAASCPSLSKLSTGTVTLQGDSSITPGSSGPPTSCTSYTNNNQQTTCSTGMSYYGNYNMDTAKAEAACDKAQYTTDSVSNKTDLIAICKQGVVFAYTANMAGLFSSIRDLACASETGGTKSSCMSSYDAQLTKCTNKSRGVMKDLQACMVTAYPSLAKQINAVTLNGTTPGQAGDNSQSCIIDLTGWLICGVAQTIANAVDSLYHVIESMMNLQPLQTDTSDASHNGLFNAWSIMRNFANVAFVIAFIIIIYSQLTSMGVSNYGIKKMLPRLIIAAILVNVSYWICAIAVDLSNIFGYSLYDLLKSVRGTVNGAVQVPLWKTVITGVLGGQAVIAGAAVSALAIAAFPEAAIWLVVPLVLAAIFAVFLAVVILIARQALVIILVFLSPLAFVAYLLPNTEKYFTMWRKSFTVMLVFFPIFSILFGGAQLASAIIISTTTSILTIILAMFIQVAPLFLTPMLIRFSGGVVGKLAGMVNNKNRGMVDRASKFARGQRDLSYKRDMSTGLGATGLRGTGRNIAARFDGFGRRRKAEGTKYENQAQSQWANSQRGMEVIDAVADTEKQGQLDSARATSRAANSSTGIALTQQLKSAEKQAAIDKAAADVMYTTDQATLELRLKARIANENLEGYQKEEDAVLKEISSRAGAAQVAGVSDDLKLSAQYAATGKNLNDVRVNSAARELQKEQAADIKDLSTGQAVYAAGIDPSGVNRVRASAIATEESATSEAIKHAVSLLQDDSTADTLIDNAEKALIKANNEGDAISARAAVNVLNSTGSAGLSRLHSTVKTIEKTGMHKDIVNGVKFDISNSGMKGKDSALDLWAIDKSKASLASIDAGTDAITRLDQRELAAQPAGQLDAWRRSGQLSEQQAQSVMDAFKKGTIPLDPAKFKTFDLTAAGDRRP